MDVKRTILNILIIAPLTMLAVFAYTLYCSGDLVLQLACAAGIVFVSYHTVRGFLVINKLKGSKPFKG